ncbi:MAG TPA: PKD domain-containing protein, partial [Gemmatimonadales bacterium]|nr:PKD domain-containing protein [Gemmatimonadales bacterium]
FINPPPPPQANFYNYPSDPSTYDVVQFYDGSYDPGGIGIQTWQWSFGDGATATGSAPTHRYAADGDYQVHLTVTTYDGRSGSIARVIPVRTHDVAITKLTVPNAASSGQTRSISVGVVSNRYPEIVTVSLYKSVPGGYQQIGALQQSVPIRSSNRTTSFNFSYTFTADDAVVGKVTFRAVATIQAGRDALPADNDAIAPPTKVSR